MFILRAAGIALLLPGPVKLAQLQAADVPALPEVIDAMSLTKRQLIEDSMSWRIVYAREKSEQLLGTGGIERMEWELIRDEDAWSVKRRFLDPRTVNDIVVPAEPRIRLIKNRRYLEWDQWNSQVVVAHCAKEFGLEDGWDYFRNLGFNIHEYMARSAGFDFDEMRDMPTRRSNFDHPWLPETLDEHRSEYRFAPNQETVDGVNCWVLEWPEMDKLWLDPDLNFAVRRRIYHWAPGKARKFEIFNRDFREVKPGLSLPFQQVVDRYEPVDHTPESQWGKVNNRSTYRVSSIEFGNVSDSTFNPMLPAGTTVTDEILDIQYRVAADGADPFSAPIGAATKLSHTSSIRPWLILLNVLLILAIAYWIVRSRRIHHA